MLQGQFNIMEMIFLNILIFFLYTPTPSKSIPFSIYCFLLQAISSKKDDDDCLALQSITEYINLLLQCTSFLFIIYIIVLVLRLLKKGKQCNQEDFGVGEREFWVLT